ncbi:MAG: hypothetical protein JOZ81_27045 [Chloroflexi bacterium]|nr:hypothetical protein [Chloroflexota bacterium]MBV9546790.1 hypothetical protein [Chloroflexota bacterium]
MFRSQFVAAPPVPRPSLSYPFSALARATVAAVQLLSLGFATLGARATLGAIGGQLLADARSSVSSVTA